MRIKTIIHAFSLVVLILMSACVTANQDSRIKPLELLKCGDTSDCPESSECRPEDHICVKSPEK